MAETKASKVEVPVKEAAPVEAPKAAEPVKEAAPVEAPKAAEPVKEKVVLNRGGQEIVEILNKKIDDVMTFAADSVVGTGWTHEKLSVSMKKAHEFATYLKTRLTEAVGENQDYRA